MNYTAEDLYNRNVENVKVIYDDGSFDFFASVDYALEDYLFNGHEDDASVVVYPTNADYTPREDWTLCYIDQFLDVINSGNRVQFDIPDREIDEIIKYY